MVTRVLLAKTVDDQILPTLAGTALILGRSQEELEAFCPPSDEPGGVTLVGREVVAALPPEWVRDGQRRTREAQAATGSTKLLDVFRLWVEQLGNAIEVDDDLNVWMALRNERS